MLRIKGARQIGKSSLLNQILDCAQTKNYATVTVDFQEVESAIFGDLDKFLQWFCASISYQLGLESQLEEYWESEIGSKVSCRIYLESYLLRQLDRPLVLAINELNRLFEYPDLTRDFLSMLRFWHEQSKSEALWQKLRLILVHSTDIYVPLHLSQSPFNVGLSLQLPLFDLGQTAELATRYGLDFKQDEDNANLLAKLYYLINGHPFLTSLAFYHLQTERISLKELIVTAPTPEGIFHNHLLSLLVTLQSDINLVAAFQKVIATPEDTFVDAIVAHKLESLGLVEFNKGLVKPICELYRLYFQQQLVN
ncbi:MAG: AAA-like domain-containing protein [Cyanobacteria bacterium P01_C01_bin.38]